MHGLVRVLFPLTLSIYTHKHLFTESIYNAIKFLAIWVCLFTNITHFVLVIWCWNNKQKAAQMHELFESYANGFHPSTIEGS